MREGEDCYVPRMRRMLCLGSPALAGAFLLAGIFGCGRSDHPRQVGREAAVKVPGGAAVSYTQAERGVTENVERIDTAVVVTVPTPEAAEKVSEQTASGAAFTTAGMLRAVGSEREAASAVAVEQVLETNAALPESVPDGLSALNLDELMIRRDALVERLGKAMQRSAELQQQILQTVDRANEAVMANMKSLGQTRAEIGALIRERVRLEAELKRREAVPE